MKRLMPILFAIVSLNVSAKNIPNANPQFLLNCAAAKDCELQLFTEISKTYRPAKEEGELRDYILQIKQVAETQIWKQKLETFQDKIGNLMIRIPATGKYAKENHPYFSLQSHMDMVLAYAGAKPGEDIKQYFKNGVELEVVDGWLQSKNRQTTLGSDNGIGVAMALRYLIAPQMAHPPLELIFTVQEEIGLVGAYNSELPILSKKMLCLDGMTPEPGYIISAAQGAVASVVSFETAKNEKAAEKKDVLIQVTVTGLAGGHSGGDIHRGHLNAVKAVNALTKFLSSRVGLVKIKTMKAGDIGVLNKIPSLFRAELLVPERAMNKDLKYQVETLLTKMINQNADDAKDAQIEVLIKSTEGEKFLTTNYSLAKMISETITKIPNGVIEQDPNYFNHVKTSNNISFMEIKSNEDSSAVLGQLGFMARGFTQQGMDQITRSITDSLTHISGLANVKVETKMKIDPWIEPKTSALLRQTLTQSGVFTKEFYLNGGLEPSAFKLKIKDLEVVALGPLTQMAHSVNERLKVDTVEPTARGVLAIVQAQ